MFLSGRISSVRPSGFPRVRGDVPASNPQYTYHYRVFPACAGMFLNNGPVEENPSRFPRVRGDVPPARLFNRFGFEFSPRARGCSGREPEQGPRSIVFPACAGMFRRLSRRNGVKHSFPRVRGDVPPGARSHRWNPTVFPACAGMFLELFVKPTGPFCFPRVRGDVPTRRPSGGRKEMFSPRARGCSVIVITPSSPPVVFPACAGMFR